MDPEKVCQICFTEAKGREKWYYHYGAVCCFRCKAFFRRYSRGEIKAKPCKGQGQCVINKGRKNCKDCRYKKSLACGMKTELLLNEEERKKYTHPKKNGKKAKVDFPSLYEKIEDAFHQAMEEMDHDTREIHTLVSGHLSSIWSLDHSSAFVKIMEESTQKFVKVFASHIPAFQSFPISDQDALVESNYKLYREYVIGQYVTADNGVNQLDWIMGLHETIPVLDLDQIQKVNFQTLNFQNNLVSGANESYYQRCLDRLKTLPRIPPFLSAFLCYYFLFNGNLSRNLIEKTKIEEMENQAKNLLKFSIEMSDLEIGTDILDELTQVLFSMVSLRKESFGISKIESRHCTQSEKQWIESAFHFLITQVNPSLPTDWDYVECYLAFNAGVPHVRPKFFFESQNLTRNRINFYIRSVFGLNINVSVETAATALMIGGPKADSFQTLGQAVKFVSGLDDLGTKQRDHFSDFQSNKKCFFTF